MATTPGLAAPALTRARLAAAAGFFTQGFVFISLTTRLPKVQDHWHYSDTTLSLLLLMMVLLAGLGSVIAETACKRVDSAVILRTGLLGIAVAVPVFAARSRPGGVHGFDGAVRRIARRRGRDHQHAGGRARAPLRPADPSLVPRRLDPGRASSASAVALAMGHLPLSATGVVAVLPLVVAFAPFLRRAQQSVTDAPVVHVPWRPIVLVGLAMVLFYMVDTAAFTWGPQYLDKVFPTPSAPRRARGLPVPARERHRAAAGRHPRREVRPGAGAAGRRSRRVRRRSRSRCSPRPGRWPSLGFLVMGGGVAVVAPSASRPRPGSPAADEPDPVAAARAGRRCDRRGSTSSTTPARCSVR